MVGESFHPRGCWGEDSDHIRLGATVQKLLRLFAYDYLQEANVRKGAWHPSGDAPLVTPPCSR
jgi:hypothetical protein